MKKYTTTLFFFVIFIFLFTSSSYALTFADGGTALKNTLDDIAEDGDFDIDVQNDYIPDTFDSTWEAQGTATANHILAFQIAGFKDLTKFGIYDPFNNDNKLQLFDGSSDYQGGRKTLEVLFNTSTSSWEYYLNAEEPLIDSPDATFQSRYFGYYLDSSLGNGGGLFYSDTGLNTDGTDHMAAYRGDGTEFLKIAVDINEDGNPNGYREGFFGVDQYILAWEDLLDPSDQDYNDLGILVESVQPIPEPTTMLLFGTGLLGLAGLGRKKFMKK